ncbi:MAG: bifunctional diguanylate cyclase/phosphodiesterase [Gammaproteobacteria bacterium]
MQPALAVDVDQKKQNQNDHVIELTADERSWLNAHKKIKIAFDGAFPPYSFIDENGQIQGIAVEIVTLISQRLGLEFETQQYADWNKLYEAAATKKLDVVATMVNRPERQEWFHFTQPYLAKSLAIITRIDTPLIKYRSDIAGKTIALLKNYKYVDRVLEEFPSITPYWVDSFLDGLNSVVSGESDAAITFIGSGHYLIKKHELNALKIAAFYDHNSSNESIAIRKDWPKLATILQKGLDSISQEEKQQIYDKWVPKIKSPVDYVLIGKIVAAFLAILLLLLLWIFQIRRQNRKIRKSRNEAQQAIKSLKDLQCELENLVSQRTAELKTSEQKFRSLVENLRDEYFFYHHDCYGVLSYVSPSVSNILGYTAEEFLIYYRDFLTDNPVNQAIDKYITRCIQGEQQTPYEIEIYDKNGRIHWFEVLETPVYDDTGKCTGVDGIAHDITERKETHQLLTSLSYYDELTGLANRRLFMDRLQQALNLANRNKWPVSVLYLDLDRFKSVNDDMGHTAGDEILKETARRMLALLRDSDVAARMGGDEFVLLLPETDTDPAALVAQKLLKSLRLPFHIGENMLTLGTSIGIAVYPSNGTDAETLINHADTAMYSAKKEKKGFSFFQENMQQVGLTTNQLKTDLIQAVKVFLTTDSIHPSENASRTPPQKSKKNQFSVHYQSQHFISTGEIKGFEALIRWLHPQQGLIAPSQFIPLAEEAGLIDTITDWMITQASIQARAWDKAGIRTGRIGVNLSSTQLAQKDLAEKIGRLIAENDAKPEWLEIEVPEKAIMDDFETAVTAMKTLEQAGLTVSIDNFGTYIHAQDKLKRLPADIIKIDQSLIRHLPDNSEHVARVGSIIAIAHSLGKSALAEGVETQDQLDFLKKKGCDNVQGYLFSKPLPIDEAESFLKNLSWFLKEQTIHDT